MVDLNLDINPSALTSRPSTTTATVPNKTLNIPIKPQKLTQIGPRVDLQPFYTGLKSSISAEQWAIYKDAVSQFLIGRLCQNELGERINPILYAAPEGNKLHLHNQLIAGILCNVTREAPDSGLAPWVGTNDKPASNVGSKPACSDATERRIKRDVMLLPSRDRRRIKDLANNDFDPYDAMSNMFSEHHRSRVMKAADAPVSAGAGGISRTNFDIEIKKRFAQPLAVESGEFPDVGNIEARMLPLCYESGLTGGHVGDAAQLMALATENFVKELLSKMFSRTRSNPPGDTGSAGLGPKAGWIQTHKYRRQLRKEEEAAQNGELSREKGGLLPVEAKAASDRIPLGLADLGIALHMGDNPFANFPALKQALINSYREGELEVGEDYTWIDGHEEEAEDDNVFMSDAFGNDHGAPLTNGANAGDAMDIDEDPWWDGADDGEGDVFDDILDSVLTAA